MSHHEPPDPPHPLDIAARALELCGEARERFVNEACAGDYELWRKVRWLLEDATQRDRQRSDPAARPPLPDYRSTPDRIQPGGTTPSAPPLPVAIGPFRPLAVLGEGGMGVVYLAEQSEPVRRQVALKVIQASLKRPLALARFDAERQAMARLSHPHIAQLYEAGTTDDSFPYFAMEHVAGQSLKEYCDAQRLTVEQRLRLFVQVCQGVQHAHQKGILHRDLKPSNVMVAEVGGRPVPKVIDFGIAKAMDEPLTEVHELTGMGTIGTPAYMSPEARVGGDVDTRSDLYSLGIMLYELIAGQRPGRPDLGAPRSDAALIRPPAVLPSRRISDFAEETAATVADQRRLNPTELARRVKGDLDAIVMKAIADEPELRYASASDLAADITRHLNSEPVSARPPSLSYRLGRFVRRHRVGVAASAVAVVALVAGIAGTLVGFVRATHEARRANREAATAASVSDFMIELFKVSDPSTARGRTITAKEILDIGAQRIENELADQPLVQARLLHAMGTVYTSLGLLDQAIPLLNRSLELRRVHLPDSHEDVAESLDALGVALSHQGRYDEAESLLREALAIRRNAHSTDPMDVAQSLNDLALVLHAKGGFDEAETMFRESLGIAQGLDGRNREEVAATLNNLGLLLHDRGDFAAAAKLLREVLEMRRGFYGTDHPLVASSLHNLAMALWSQGELGEAEVLVREAEALNRRLLGDEHHAVVSNLNTLGGILAEQGRTDDAILVLREAIGLIRHLHGESPMLLSESLNSLAVLLKRQGNLEGAEPLYREALEINRTTVGPDHPFVALCQYNLASLLTKQQRFAEAEPLFRDALRIYELKLGPDHPNVAIALARFAEWHMAQERFAEAEPLLVRALSILEERLPADHPRVLSCKETYATLLHALEGDDAVASPAEAR